MFSTQVEHSEQKTVKELYDHIEKVLKPEKFAVILHDKDINEETGELSKPHFQVIFIFKNHRYIQATANKLGVEPQFVSKWDDNVNNLYGYLIHATDGAKDKHQYDPSEVIANFNYVECMEKITKEISEKESKDFHHVDEVIDLIYAGEINLVQAEEMLPASVYSKHENRIESTFNRYLRKLARAWREMMIALGESVIVIWLYGLSRTGKSSFAKEFAKKYAEMYDTDYYKSGSTKDPFQRYDGSHVIILDELRANIIEYSDFLRLLDPFSTDKETMGASRFKDKGIACNIWIITSPYNPYKFYKKYSKIDREVDTFDQLDERLDYTIEMTQDEIIETEFDEATNTYKPVNRTYNPYSKKNRPPQIKTSRGLNLFKDMIGFSEQESVEREVDRDGFTEVTDYEQQELPFDLLSS